MVQSAFPVARGNGLHVAIIMDGNSHWARHPALPRLVGHRAGTENVYRIVSACPDLGIRSLTLCAFSTENWGRPQPEVDGRMRSLGEFIDRATRNLHSEGVQIRHLGQKEGGPLKLQRKIACGRADPGEHVPDACRRAQRCGRADSVAVVRALAAARVDPEAIDEQTISNDLSTSSMPDPALIIRTSSEERRSNVFTWQAAYSEWKRYGIAH